MSINLTDNNYNGDMLVGPEPLTYDVPASITMDFNKLVYNVDVDREIDDQDFDPSLITNEIVSQPTYPHYKDNQEEYPGSVLYDVSRVSWGYTFKSRRQVRFKMTYNRAGYTTVSLTEYSDNGDGRTLVTSTDHGMTDEDKVKIIGSTNYSGVHVIEYVDEDTFIIPEAFVADDGDEGSYAKLFLSFTVENVKAVSNPYDLYAGHDF